MPALANRYSISSVAGMPADADADAARLAACPGATQPSAVFVMELAKPTTVSRCAPIVSTLPTVTGCGPLGDGVPLSTIWPEPVTQRPALRTRSSTGPPGPPRPTTRMPPYGWPSTSDETTLTSVKGPDAAVTPPSFAVAAIRDALAVVVFSTRAASAPRWAANALSNGALVAASNAKPSAAEAVEISSTAQITSACTLCRSRPPAAVRTAPSQLIA